MPQTQPIVRISSGGSLSCWDLTLACSALRSGGLGVVPSDTCYALAGLPFSRDSVGHLVTLLPAKATEPIPLVFGSIPLLERFVKLTVPDRRIIEVVWPGPLTLVCEISSAHDKTMLQEVLHTDGTIGARYSDSVVERQLSAHLQRPLTTCAIRDDSGEPVRNFDDAMYIVRSRMQAKNEQFPLFHIRVDRLPYAQLSTVATVQKNALPANKRTEPLDSVFVYREGEVEPKRLKKAVRELSPSDWVDWT